MTSEDTYLAALRLVDTVTREGAALALSGPETVLRFCRLPPVPQDSLVGRNWLLERVLDGETSVPTRGERATLEFHGDGTLLGSTGCRRLTGTYIVEGEEILATELAAKGRCPRELADQDAYVVTVLGDGFTVAIEGDELTLMSMGNLGLVYRAS
jgi:heat shock protein HslJ